MTGNRFQVANAIWDMSLDGDDAGKDRFLESGKKVRASTKREMENCKWSILDLRRILSSLKS